MKKRLRFIFILAALTATGILVFQIYWVYNSYKTSERNFNTQVLNVLQKTLDAYPLHENKLPITLNEKSPSLAVMSSFDKGPKKGSLYNVKFQPLSVSAANLTIVQQMVAKLMAQTEGKPVKLKLLNTLFKNELKKVNIDVPFNLVLLKGRKQLPENKIAAFVSFSTNSDIVEATPGGLNAYLLRQNTDPAVISAFLILLSAGSLYYMGLIIRRQVRLDEIKNDFISNITHELRTPISILKSTHEALYKFGEAADVEKTARYLLINTEILNKLENNVDRILDISNYEQGTSLVKAAFVDVDELIANVIMRFNLDPERIQYLSEFNGKELLTDAYMIDTIVANLIDNAFKYNDENVKVMVKVMPLQTGWQLQVKDNGQGISEQYLPFIFDKFYRVPFGNLHDVKGYGLGLSYVRQLVNALKGTIKVKSRPGETTVFTLQFPNYG